MYLRKKYLLNCLYISQDLFPSQTNIGFDENIYCLGYMLKFGCIYCINYTSVSRTGFVGNSVGTDDGDSYFLLDRQRLILVYQLRLFLSIKHVYWCLPKIRASTNKIVTISSYPPITLFHKWYDIFNIAFERHVYSEILPLFLFQAETSRRERDNLLEDL